jgi:mannose-6-phosphate isomerase-like protein (cupin superfamily)
MNAEQTMLEAFKRRPTVEMSTWYKGILVSHLATEKDTGGAFDLVMSRMRSGTEPPPHIHEREHEVFYVLEGELEVYVAGEYFRAGVGECVFLPARKAHAFKIASPEIRMLVMSCLSWNWRGRSSVKITERTHEKRTKALHRRREGCHPEAALVG